MILMIKVSIMYLLFCLGLFSGYQTWVCVSNGGGFDDLVFQTVFTIFVLCLMLFLCTYFVYYFGWIIFLTWTKWALSVLWCVEPYFCRDGPDLAKDSNDNRRGGKEGAIRSRFCICVLQLNAVGCLRRYLVTKPDCVIVSTAKHAWDSLRFPEIFQAIIFVGRSYMASRKPVNYVAHFHLYTTIDDSRLGTSQFGPSWENTSQRTY